MGARGPSTLALNLFFCLWFIVGDLGDAPGVQGDSGIRLRPGAPGNPLWRRDPSLRRSGGRSFRACAAQNGETRSLLTLSLPFLPIYSHRHLPDLTLARRRQLWEAVRLRTPERRPTQTTAEVGVVLSLSPPEVAAFWILTLSLSPPFFLNAQPRRPVGRNSRTLTPAGIQRRPTRRDTRPQYVVGDMGSRLRVLSSFCSVVD